MSKTNRIVLGVCLILSVCSVLFMMFYSGYMSRKVAKVYANKDTVTEVKKPKPLFDVNDAEATKSLLDKVSQLGQDVADIQNQYRGYYKQLSVLDDGPERTKVLSEIKELNKKMPSYFNDDVLDDNWELFDPSLDWEWKFEPIYQYGGEKIPVMWVLQDKAQPTTHYMIITASYGLKREVFDNCHTYLTSEGVGVQMSLNEDDTNMTDEEILESLKELAEEQKKGAKEYNESHGATDATEIPDKSQLWEERKKNGNY